MTQPSQASLDMIKKIVGFKTISRTSNLALIDYVRGLYDEYHIPYRLSYDPAGDRANIFATIGPDDKAGVILSGHVDVVPVEGQQWDTDPFTATIKDGKIFGRGTVDMKGFVSIVLAQLPKFVKANLKTPLHISLTYDEEVGCEGIKVLLADLKSLTHKPKACILGEATSMKIVGGHKGKADFKCKVYGKEGHSSLLDNFVNALEYAAKMVVFLKDLNAHNRKIGPFNNDFEPNYSTVHTGIFHAGTALNIVPNIAEFDFEFRCIPGQDPSELFNKVKEYADTLTKEMQKISPTARVDLIPTTSMAPMETAEDTEVMQLVKSLTGENHVGRFSGGTEGGDYNAGGIPTIVIGPGITAMCHQPNEYLELDQIAKCEAFLDKLIAKLSS